MFYLVCYDIVSDYRRNKVSQLLEGYGMRVQRSVFECVLSDSQYKLIVQEIRRRIDLKSDQVGLYPLSSRDRQNVNLIGLKPEFTVDDSAYIA